MEDHFLFIGLFILVGGLVKVGVIRYLADQLVVVTQGNLAGSTMAVLWGSAFLSALVDNIPYVAAMNPLIVDLARSLHPEMTDYATLVHQPDILPLWWALALGACLGERHDHRRERERRDRGHGAQGRLSHFVLAVLQVRVPRHDRLGPHEFCVPLVPLSPLSLLRHTLVIHVFNSK